MPLPNPLPDNPQRWEGWRQYNSPNYYERLGLSFDSNASTEQIEDNCRQLLVWWQKKLPLKNQPSNPLSQILRAGLDEAPSFLAEARTALLDPELRRAHDEILRAEAIAAAIEEFNKLIKFTLSEKKLSPEAEERLVVAGMNLGLSQAESQEAIEVQLAATGAVRVQPPAPQPPPPPPPSPAAAPKPVPAPATPGANDQGAARDPFLEFRRLLKMSRLCLDGEEMTDDQRDAMCNLGESLGLTGGQAEDLIDEYLDQVSGMPAQSTPRPIATASSAVVRAAPPRPAPVAASAPAPVVRAQPTVITPLMRAQEREKFRNFRNLLGGEMLLVSSGSFEMGNRGPNALANEQPATPVTISRFYMSRFPITNVQYERFDPAHVSKRAPWADDQHPVIYVTAKDAERFCEWLSQTERRKYRLPTEAEWEYAARGAETRIFPWGDVLDAGCYANFADSRTAFGWRDQRIDDGWAQTSPVGYYPRGASPFGIEDLAGNVFEWCLDGLEAYKGKEMTNPRGPKNSSQRIYRGGSWKSRSTSLRSSARAFNSPDYSSNDVGFRIVCECD